MYITYCGALKPSSSICNTLFSINHASFGKERVAQSGEFPRFPCPRINRAAIHAVSIVICAPGGPTLSSAKTRFLPLDDTVDTKPTIRRLCPKRKLSNWPGGVLPPPHALFAIISARLRTVRASSTSPVPTNFSRLSSESVSRPA